MRGSRLNLRVDSRPFFFPWCMWAMPLFSLKLSCITMPMPSSMRGICGDENCILKRLRMRMKTRIIGKEHCTKETQQKNLAMPWKVKMIKKWDVSFYLLATCSMCFPCLVLQANVKWGFMVIPPRKYDIISPTGGKSVFQGVFTRCASEHQHTHELLKQHL